MTLELVLTPLILAALTVLSTVVGVWDKISSRARNAVILASILILTSVMSQIVQINEVRKQARTNEAQAVTNEKQAKIIEDKRVLIESLLKRVDEASGGAVDGPVAYIIDDNDPFIYVFEYVKAEGKYRPRDYKMKIVDARPCSNRSIFWELEECNEAIFTELTQPMIRDLEGAALHDGKLYLTTSQSSTERQKFLEVSLDGKVLRATKNIRGAILNLLRNFEGANESEDVQVEGLAIDKNGYVYFGFRSPLIDGLALVISADIDQVFSDNPKFESFLLDLRRRDSRYGITSLDYDRETDQILVLGNSPSKPEILPTAIWSWKVKHSKGLQYPEAFTGDIFTVFDAPGSRPAKPEVILQPIENRIHLFFDAEGVGGQLSLLRKGTSVSRSLE